MGLFKSQKEVLVSTDHCNFIITGCFVSTYTRFSCCTVYLYTVLDHGTRQQNRGVAKNSQNVLGFKSLTHL